MTKVLLITKLFYPVYGGVETAVAQLAATLAKDPEYKVTILAGNEQSALNTKRYDWQGVTIVKAAGFGTVYNTALSPAYAGLLKKLVAENDVLHFQSPNPLGELAFNLGTIPPDKRVIVTVHADVSQTRRKKFAPLYNRLLEKMLQRANVITTMSPQNLDGFPVLQPYRSKCQVVPLAYDSGHMLEVDEEQQAAFRKKYDLDEKLPIVLFVGRLSAYKGVDVLIEAIASLANAQLLIVGDGEVAEDLKQQAIKMGITAVFTGFLQGTAMACAYSVATVFVLPSRTETFGIVQAEAMHFGLPIINTDLKTGVNFVSPHQETGLTVPPGDAVALAAAIETILNDEKLRNQFAEKAKLRVALFSPERMTNRFKQLYAEDKAQGSASLSAKPSTS